VSDDTGEMRLTFWNEKADETISKEINLGDKVCVSKLNPRENTYMSSQASNLEDGKVEPQIELHSNRITEIIKMAQSNNTLLSEPISIDSLKPGLYGITTFGLVSTEPKQSDFKMRNGEDGTLIYFRMNSVGSGSSASVNVKFWNEQPQSISDIKKGDILLIRNVQTKEGQNQSLEISSINSTSVEINPEEYDFPNETVDSSDDTIGPETKINKINVNNSGVVKGTIERVLPNIPVYPACPDCKKKLVKKEDTNRWFCSKCEKNKKPQYTVMLRVVINDGIEEVTASVFGEVAEKITTKTATKINSHLKLKKNENVDPWETPLLKQISEDIKGQEFMMTIRKQMNHSTNQEQYIINDIEKIDVIDEANKLIDKIEEEIN